MLIGSCLDVGVFASVKHICPPTVYSITIEKIVCDWKYVRSVIGNFEFPQLNIVFPEQIWDDLVNW